MEAGIQSVALLEFVGGKELSNLKKNCRLNNNKKIKCKSLTMEKFAYMAFKSSKIGRP